MKWAVKLRVSFTISLWATTRKYLRQRLTLLCEALYKRVSPCFLVCFIWTATKISNGTPIIVLFNVLCKLFFDCLQKYPWTRSMYATEQVGLCFNWIEFLSTNVSLKIKHWTFGNMNMNDIATMCEINLRII